MAFALAHLTAIDDDNVYTTARTTASFTPTANSTLVIIAGSYWYSGGSAAFLWSIAGSAGGLTFTKQKEQVQGAYSTVCWTAPVGGSPVAMTITVDPHSGNSNTYGTAVQVFSVRDTVVGPLTLVQSASGIVFGTANSNQSVTSTFGAAPVNGNLVCGVATAGSSDAATTITLPTGFTNLNLQSAVFSPSRSFHRSNTTATGVTAQKTVTDALSLLMLEFSTGGGTVLPKSMVWDGSAWVDARPKVWDGTQWKNAVAKVWDGSQWKSLG